MTISGSLWDTLNSGDEIQQASSKHESLADVLELEFSKHGTKHNMLAVQVQQASSKHEESISCLLGNSASIQQASPQSRGGLTRSANLSAEERSSIARQAAQARWGNSSTVEATSNSPESTRFTFGQLRIEKIKAIRSIVTKKPRPIGFLDSTKMRKVVDHLQHD